MPYLDYATPDFYDLLTGQIQELGAGDVSPTEFLGTLEKEYSGFVRGRASYAPMSHPHSPSPGAAPAGRLARGGSTGAARSVRRASRGRSRYLYVAPALVVFGRLPAVAAAATPCGSRSSSGTASASASGWVSTTTARCFRPVAAGAVRARPGAGRSSSASVPVVLGLALAALMSRSSLRGSGFFRSVLFLPQVVAIRGRGGRLARDLRAAGSAERRAARRRPGLFGDGWLGESSTALIAIGLVGTWVGTGLCIVLFLSGLSKVRTRAVRGGAARRRRAGARVLRGQPARRCAARSRWPRRSPWSRPCAPSTWST